MHWKKCNGFPLKVQLLWHIINNLGSFLLLKFEIYFCVLWLLIKVKLVCTWGPGGRWSVVDDGSTGRLFEKLWESVIYFNHDESNYHLKPWKHFSISLFCLYQGQWTVIAPVSSTLFDGVTVWSYVWIVNACRPREPVIPCWWVLAMCLRSHKENFWCISWDVFEIS